jgi:hypothetical protein
LTIIGQVNVPSTAIPKVSPRLPIAAREQRCTKEQVDLSRQYNAALHETWFPITELSQVDLNLAALPPGLRTVGPIQFDVRGVIQLRRAAMLWDWGWSVFPERVSIPVGTKCGRFHVLHGAMYAQGFGRQVGTYRLHYSDGTEHSFPVQLGRDVEDWSWPPSSPGAMTPAWQTKDPSNPSQFLRLYAQTFVNPQPDREVSSLEFISTLSDAGPFLVALTIE